MANIQTVKTFEDLLSYLGDELNWPVRKEDIEDLSYDYQPYELGITDISAINIAKIVRFRPFTATQKWSIFYIEFANGNLPVVVLRRILNNLVVRQRATRTDSQRWQMHDLLFISSHGAPADRHISFAHFAESSDGSQLPTLRVLGWDGDDTKLRLANVETKLQRFFLYPEKPDDLNTWSTRWASAFTLRPNETINTSKQLAKNLAQLARDIRDRLNTVMQYESDKGQFTLLMKSFQSALIHDLNADDFADMYAQTIAYGLLSTRIAAPTKTSVDDFTLTLQTNPFLRDLLTTFMRMGGRDTGGSGLDFDELGIADVSELLNHANMSEVLRDFNNRNAAEDPVIHFYELFLKEYDAKKRMARGVFYTPKPVVGYIVRSVHELLQRDFGLADGLADTTTWGDMLQKHPDLKLPDLSDDPSRPRLLAESEPFVQILDPATGTGTFLVEVIDVIHRTLVAKWEQQRLTDAQQRAAWNDYVPHHLLPRLHAFELMMAPYAIAHLKIGLKLAETGYRFGTEERARIYLTNALEPWVKQLPLIGFDALAHEAAAVNEIKRHKRFTVVIGNPPYAGVSSNEGPWIENLLRSPLSDGAVSYFTFNGAPLDEPNTRWLNDDYVKFMRLAQSKVANSRIGIIGLITNHSWFENPTFRGMRQSTTQTFSQIYLLDLHGNTKKKEAAPDGSKDENVFDIQQGVAISLMVSRSVDTSIRHADLFGLQSDKYGKLLRNSVGSTHWHSLTPDLALMLWRRFDATNSDEYQSYPVITDIFSSGGGDGRGSSWAKGLATTKDHLFISFDQTEAFEKIGLLASTSVSDSHVGDTLSLEDTPYFTIADVRRAIRKGDWKARVCSVIYRPFDTRVLYWHPELYDVGRGASSKRVMSHLFKPNIALVTSRMTKGESFAHTFVTRCPVEVIFLSSKTSNNAFVFPLKYYPDLNSQMDLVFDQAHFRTNLNPTFLRRLAQSLGLNVTKDSLPADLTPEDIFHYIYAVFHSPGYRSRYAEFLKIDFPRLPLTESIDLFRALAHLGEQLVALHLMESPLLDTPITQTVGDNWTVGKVGYADGTVWVDGKGTKGAFGAGTTGFVGVPEEVWNFHIGGYQVCEKWLKDRKNRTLSADDIAHYQKIVVALHETIRLMAEIDVVIDAHGGWPGAFQSGDAVDAVPEPARPQFGQVPTATSKRKAAEDKDQGSFLDE